MPQNKAMKLTSLSAAPGLDGRRGVDGGAASCPRGELDAGTGSQLIASVGRTGGERMRGIAGCVVLCASCAISVHPEQVATVPGNRQVIVAALGLALADAAANAAPFEVYCVDMGSGGSLDASARDALPACRVPVVPYAACRKERTTQGFRYVRRAGGGRGVRVYAEVSKWHGPDAALVSYGWEQYDLAARLCSAEMARRDGKWVVTEVLHCVQA